MKLKLIVCFLIAVVSAASAQEFEVRSFEADPSDMAARRNPRTTVNDEPAALIKVVTNIEGMMFDSNLGIVDYEHREAEYWLYVPPRERRIRLMASEFLAKDVSLPEPAESNMVYHLVVTRKGMLAPATDLVRLTFRLNESNVYIRRGDQAPVPSAGQSPVFYVERGEHSFRFIKEDFEEKTLTLDVTDDEEVFVELSPGQVTTPFEPPGFIIIDAEQPGTEIYLNEQRVGITPYQNTHISGEYSLLLRHPDYHDHYQSFSLEAGATMTIPTVNLKPRYGHYQVTSSPSGAEVLLNNSLAGHTPLSKTQISSEYHELTVRYSMYHDHNETFTIEDGDHKQFDVVLKPAFGGVRITSEPAGARVYIGGREVGTTPYENMQKPSGRYNVRLSRDLYGDAMETIVVNDGETTERFVPLAQNYGSLQIQADDADIYLDGAPVGRESFEQDLTPGRYVVKAVRPQHNDDEREVFIRLAQTEKVTLAPAPRTGYVSIASEPFEAGGAEIWIDGVRQEQVTPAVIPLLEGSYDVSLKKEGFAEYQKKIFVEENKTLNVSAEMTKKSQVLFTSQPSDADIFINNEKIGTTPHIEMLSFGSYDLRIQKGVSQKKQIINVRAESEQSFQLDLLTKVTINTWPENANVQVKGQPTSSARNLSLSHGTYDVHVSSDNFISRRNSIIVDSENNRYSFRLRPSYLGGIGYIYGPSGVNMGMEVFTTMRRITLGLSMIHPEALTPTGFETYTTQSLSGTIGVRILYPLDFSLNAGYGFRNFINANDSEDRKTFDSFILGAILPIYLSEKAILYLKGDYWFNTEESGIFVFSTGVAIQGTPSDE